LPKKRVLERGDPMQILCGTFKDHVALYDGMLPHERFAVLLNFMGAQGASNSIASTSGGSLHERASPPTAPIGSARLAHDPLALNQRVQGSSPCAPTNKHRRALVFLRTRGKA
jgi:hypothetical protein